MSSPHPNRLPQGEGILEERMIPVCADSRKPSPTKRVRVRVIFKGGSKVTKVGIVFIYKLRGLRDLRGEIEFSCRIGIVALLCWKICADEKTFKRSSGASLTWAQNMEEKVAMTKPTAEPGLVGDGGRWAVELKNVQKTYRTGPIEIPALRGVSLRIAPGEFLAVAGPSGSGKTTLLNIIGGLDRADAGDVCVEGNNLQLLSSGELARMRLERLGFVFQAYNLLPVLTAMENAEFTLLLQGVPLERRRERVQKLFLEIGLAGLENRRPAELSGGQQQRVAVARAMVTEPALILADEPTANLDSATGAALLDVMEQLNRAHNTTFIFSTHDPQVMDRARRWIRLRDGQIASDAAHASHILSL